MDSQDPSTCHVCFVKPLKLLHYSKIIKCIQCHLTCHKSCYNPSLFGDKFVCDLCTEGKKRPEPCFICGNPGLLKKVEDRFAHPICLLFSALIIVTQYKSLQFSIIREQIKKDNKTKCSVCKKTGHLEKCFSKCNNQAHMYCIWKDYHKAQINSQEGGWNHNPVINAVDYRFFFEKKAKQYLSLINPHLLPYFKSLSKAKHKTRQFELVCPNHTQSMFECCMNEKYFGKNENQIPIEYAQCEQCLRWYHQECLDKGSIQKVIKQKEFICEPCQNFQRMLGKIQQSQKLKLKAQLKLEQKQHEVYLKEPPRLNICELVYLQCLYEQKKYILSPNELQLMFHLPVEPSLIFLEQDIKKNILSKLKTGEFEEISHSKIKLRMEKKEFKEKFSKNIQKELQFLVGNNSLLERTNDQEEQSGDQHKSEKIVDEEERQKLKSWIQLLMDFKAMYPEFDKVVSKLMAKMNRWLKTLTEELIKKQQESYENQFMKHQSDFQKIEEQSIMSTNKQELLSELSIKSQQQQQASERQQISQEIQEKQIQKIRQDERHFNPLNTLTLEKRSKHKNILFLDKKIENDLLNSIQMVQKKAYTNSICVHQAYEILTKQHKNKSFTLDIMLNSNLSSKHSTLKLLILEVLFQNFLQIQENSKYLLKESQINNESYQIIQNKDLMKKKHHRSIKYLEQYIRNLKIILDKSNIEVKKQFNYKIQYLCCNVTDLIKKYQKEILKLQNKINVLQALNEYEKNPVEKIHLIKRLKQQLGPSSNFEELAVVRIQMEKIEVYKRIKKVKFTNDCHIKMMDQYNDHCKSSSQNIQKESFQSQDTKKIDLRKEILAIQQQSLRIWLAMHGAIFHLANQFISMEKMAKYIKNLGDGQIKQSVSQNKEPLEIIEDILKLDFSIKQQDYKKDIFLRSLTFFSRIKKAKINYKIFHESLISVIQKLGKICIIFSFQNIQFWASKEDNFKTVKSIYKNFRNSDFFNQNIELKYLFIKIWEVFQTDESFQAYLQENQWRLFDDPEFTNHLFVERLPEMIKFYNEIGFVNRVQQLRTISMWIACYLRILKEIGFERFFGNDFKDSQLRKKYQKPSKTTFNQINELVALLQKAKVPKSYQFIKKVLKLYQEAKAIQIQVQKYFANNNFFIDKSMELKKQLLKQKSIDKDCIQYSEESFKLQKTVSKEEFQRLIETLSNNSLSNFVTWELQKRAIQNQRADFIDLTQKIQNVLLKSDTSIPIKDLNQIFFEVISYPFPYQNLSLLFLYIRQRVQRSKILCIQQRSISKKRKQKVESVQMIYKNLLDSLEPKEKMHSQNRMTRDQIMSKVYVVEQLPEFKQIMAHPVLKQMRQKILAHLETFDGIKEDCQMIVQRINQNKLLATKEILSLSQSLSHYKQQRVFELAMELMYLQVEIYKLSFSSIPETLLDMQMQLEQLRSLKPSFKTYEILKRMKDIEVQISAKQGK